MDEDEVESAQDANDVIRRIDTYEEDITSDASENG